MKIRSLILTASLTAVPAALVGCRPDAQTPTDANTPTEVSASKGKPGAPGAASERMFFKVKLEPEGDSQARGMLHLEIVGGYLTARLHANGVEPLQRIPQHIHRNPTCHPGGGILINLDENLTVAGEGPGVGASYPLASHAGVVNYEARRSLAGLMAAVNQYQNAGLQTVEQLIAWLDLENRNAHMHVAFGPPYPAVNCGEIERIN
jgi:hypothetical protein